MRPLGDLGVALARGLAVGRRRQPRCRDLHIARLGAALVLQHFADFVVLFLLVLSDEVTALCVPAGVDDL